VPRNINVSPKPSCISDTELARKKIPITIERVPNKALNKLTI